MFRNSMISAQPSGSFQRPRVEFGVSVFQDSSALEISPTPSSSGIPGTSGTTSCGLIHGKHSFDFGFDFERNQSNIRNTDLENGSFSFTNDTTGLASASFVLGHLHSFSQTSGDYSDSRQTVFGLYAADKWKVSDRLTLNLGLRWEPQVQMKEVPQPHSAVPAGCLYSRGAVVNHSVSACRPVLHRGQVQRQERSSQLGKPAT